MSTPSTRKVRNALEVDYAPIQKLLDEKADRIEKLKKKRRNY